MLIRDNVAVTIKTQIWLVVVVVVVAMVVEVVSLNGPNVCMVKQKYNITKRIKYRAPMTVRTYEWCFSMPPKCSKYKTEMRDLTRLETEERMAEVAVCCPGYKMKDVSCVPICPNGKTGSGCAQDCQHNKWGPNCVNDCKACSDHGSCSPITGECVCQDGWQGESCETRMPTTTTRTTTVEESLTTKTSIPSTTPSLTTVTKASVGETSTPSVKSPLTTSSVMTSPKTSINTSTFATAEIQNISLLTDAIEKYTVNTTPVTTLTEFEKETTMHDVISTTFRDIETFEPTTVETARTIIINNYNRTELLSESTKAYTELTVEVKTVPTTNAPEKTSTVMVVAVSPKSTISVMSTTDASKEETSKKPEIILKTFPTTIKFKPKEIWIKPAQKGESSFVESKVKPTHELVHPRYRSATNKEFAPNTTPKTIIVSIIPTSVSYATFKKIALTTSSFASQKTNATITSYNRSTERGFTKSMSVLTYTPSPTTAKSNTSLPSAVPTLDHYVTKYVPSTPVTTRTSKIIKTNTTINNETNSTISTNVTPNLNAFNNLTTVSLTNEQTHKPNKPEKTRTVPKYYITTIIKKVTTHPLPSPFAKATTILIGKVTDTPVKINGTLEMGTTKKNKVTTEDPSDEEAFHILTEPEHITAVMGEKGTEQSTVDLVTVISIAGGVMMSVITVAVIIVMIERCKKHSYEDVRKNSDIRMQVMIDDDIPPPPYVRSIFHTPLPDPPTAEKCHYQPISTLDRNLKQFMRPVVVQTISPIMLENFRGILECHYDHLPRRSNDFGTMQTRCSMPPSIDNIDEPLHIRACSVTDTTIDALKCEARLDVIDSTTSEPLYAEIPCWRPPSEHAIEILNLNGEAVTEL